jgi:hypothetical protein
MSFFLVLIFVANILEFMMFVENEELCEIRAKI